MIYFKCLEYLDLCLHAANEQYASEIRRESAERDDICIVKEAMEIQAPFVKTAQALFKNYDYDDSPSGPGSGLYNGPMDKYKSVDDFRKKKMKRRKKILKRIRDQKNYRN